MNYKTYIWDLGGTLLDNYESSSRAFAGTLWELADRVVLHADAYAALKVSTAHAIELYASDVPDFLAHYKALEAVTLERPLLFDGAKEVLEAVVQLGGQNFMISHRNNQVLDILDRAGIASYFTEIVTSDNGFLRKPAPGSFIYLIDKYQLDRTETVTIGDRPIDIEAGKAAGIDGIYFDAEGSYDKASRQIRSLRELL